MTRVFAALSLALAVIGGHDARQAYPFMASLQVDGAQLCGGALIAPRWVLTAGHCAYQPAGTLQVRVGSRDRTDGGTLAGVAEMHVHPAFAFAQEGSSGPSVVNDLALIKLDRPVTQQPIRVAWERGGAATRILGWGCTHDHTAEHPCEPSGYPRRLQELDTRVVPDAQCTDLSPGRELCTRAAIGDGQACAGDSGGPQIRRSNGRWLLVGIASRPGSPAATPCSAKVVTYTNPSAYRAWILETISRD